jgi:hypothetical protein
VRDEEGSEKSFFLFGSSVRGTWREGCFTGDHGGYVKRLRKRASLSIKVPLENLKMGSFTGDFERRAKDGSGNAASVSVRAL